MFECKEVNVKVENNKIRENTFDIHNKFENINKNKDILIENPNKIASNQYIQDTANTNSFNVVNETNTILSISSQSNINEKIIELDNPLMERLQNTLKRHLIKQTNIIKQELIKLEEDIKAKKKKKDSFINETNNATSRIEVQKGLLNAFHKIQMEFNTTKEQVEASINRKKQHYTEYLTQITVKTKQIPILKRQLDHSRGLLKELTKYDEEQKNTIKMCNKKQSLTKMYKKKLLNEQQKQDLLLLSLTQEILRLEDCMKHLIEQAEIKYSESELLKQKVMDSSTDLDAINGDNSKITLLLNDVLNSIKQRDTKFQKIKDNFQEEKNKYYQLLMEANSYKRSVQEEFHKNDDLKTSLNKLKREQNDLQNSFEINLEKLIRIKNNHLKLIQMTEIQYQNLDQITTDQKIIGNEINTLLHTLGEKQNQKLKYEDANLDELRKQLFANTYCVQKNNKISKLKVANKEDELLLVSTENNLSRALLKLEQYNSTSSNLEKSIEENNNHLKEQQSVISKLNSELNTLYNEIQNKSNLIDSVDKQLVIVKKRQKDGSTLTPKMKIDQVKYKIDEIGKQIELIKQSWIKKQNSNVKLLEQRNRQMSELKELRICSYVMRTKSSKQEQEIISVTKTCDQYKRTFTNMTNTILKLNENINQTKGKSSQLFNENEWIQCSNFVELKENEKHCLEYLERLKLIKNELSEMKNVYIKKQRESRSWDTKVQLLLDMKTEMKKKDGDLDDIETMKKGIHRMNVKESQLKKILEKIMSDLEGSVSKRETIYTKFSARGVNLKGKNEIRRKFLKKLNDKQINIKKIKIECKKTDRNISDFQHVKMELESKLSNLNDKLIQVRINVDDLIKSIEDIGVTKNKNIYNLIYKQEYAKLLDQVNNEKYSLFMKCNLKVNEVYTSERKKNSDIISVVEALRNDFPHLNVQITRLFNMLKSIVNVV